VVVFAALLAIPLTGAATLLLRSGVRLEDWGQEVEEELRRCSERSAALPPFDWEPYRELLGTARGEAAGIDRTLIEFERWRGQGCPMDLEVAATDVGFSNRHWPAVFNPIRLGAVRQALLQTAVAQESCRGGGLSTALVRASSERWVHCGWHTMVMEGSLAPSELRELAGLLDRLEAARRPLKDELEVEYLLRCRMVFEIYHTGKDPERVLETQAPGWRSLWSRQVHFWRILRRLERQRARMVALASGPWTELWARRDEMARDLSPCSHLFGSMDQAILQFEGQSRLRRQLLRTAVAAALYALDEGRPPSSLDDLVPRYLPSFPRCPLTDTPLSYADGRINGDVEDPLSPWWISRRGSGVRRQD